MHDHRHDAHASHLARLQRLSSSFAAQHNALRRSVIAMITLTLTPDPSSMRWVAACYCGQHVTMRAQNILPTGSGPGLHVNVGAGHRHAFFATLIVHRWHSPSAPVLQELGGVIGLVGCIPMVP